MSEIERKFLLSAMPPKEILGTGVHVDQGYIFVDGPMGFVRSYCPISGGPPDFTAGWLLR